MGQNLKFSGIKETDNVETHEGLRETIREFLENLSHPFESQTYSVDEFEFKRRDGFIPHRHNCGGLDLLAITDVAGLMGSGEHFGTKIESWTEKQWDDARDDLKKQADDAGEEVDTDSEEFYDSVYEYCSGDYSAIGWKVRVMYEGNGVLKVYAGFDKDAPYFREGLNDFEAEIKFRTISGLARKLQALAKKVEASQNETKENKKTA